MRESAPASRGRDYAPTSADHLPPSSGPSSRARGIPTTDPSADGADDLGEVPVIRAARRTTFPRLTDSAAERTGASAPAARRHAASAIEESATRRRSAAAEAEIPKRTIDRKSILERYDRARGERSAAPRAGATSDAPGQRIKGARDKASSAGALEKRVKNARELERNDPQRIRNARDLYLESTGSLRDLAYRYPERARKYEQAGRSISHGNDLAHRYGYGSALGCTTGWWWYDWCGTGWYWNGYGDCGFYWNWWWYGCYPWSGYYWWGHPYSYSCWWVWGWWPLSYSYWYGYDGYAGPTYYTTVIERYYEPETTYVEPAAEGEGVVEAPVDRRSETAASDRALLDSLLEPQTKAELSRASEEYLVLGDNAFADRRYGDAVHFYAKAVEFSPDDGMLYLILSDALFATGDYHYAAYALRRALELDPTLASLQVDKHDFYKNDRLEFDRQLAVLELYLQDQPSDDDARLVLAANYLFGARPAAAVDLLDKPESKKLRAEPAARLIYEAAKILQFGQPAEAKK